MPNILLVDDCRPLLTVLKEALSREGSIQVVGCAEHGQAALEFLDANSVDLVLLDVEMPVMNGLEALRHIRERHGDLPVLMFSALTHRGAAATIEALMIGADDYVGKPAGMDNLNAAINVIGDTLIPKIKALCPHRSGSTATSASADTRMVTALASEGTSEAMAGTRATPQAVGIVASTGGPKALAAILGHLPSDFPLPILVVQHIVASFAAALTERLADMCRLPVREAQGGELLSEGGIWLAPGDHHLAVTGTPSAPRLAVHQEAPENEARPSADVLFRSMAGMYGNAALTMVLTGMGHDGYLGCRAVKEAGGAVLVQDEDSCRAWTTGGAVVKAGLADEITPLARLGEALLQRSRSNQAV